ncbi:hypothetical protein M8J76_009072 [Diaphorina citri]|nr:hypothetical protein M8J76_009072 [Diaphorina citri]
MSPTFCEPLTEKCGYVAPDPDLGGQEDYPNSKLPDPLGVAGLKWTVYPNTTTTNLTIPEEQLCRGGRDDGRFCNDEVAPMFLKLYEDGPLLGRPGVKGARTVPSCGPYLMAGAGGKKAPVCRVSIVRSAPPEYNKFEQAVVEGQAFYEEATKKVVVRWAVLGGNLIVLVCASVFKAISSEPPSTPTQLSDLLQKNPSFQAVLNENPSIYQLLKSNPALVKQFENNPNLIIQTEKHAKFLTSFLQEHTDLDQIIKDNPYVYAFILRQVDHALQTGQNSTIVIQTSEAEMNAQAQREMEAQKTLTAQTQSQVNDQGANSSPQVGVESNKQVDAFSGLSRDQLVALLVSMQAGQADKQTLQANGKVPPTNENQTSNQPGATGQRPSLNGVRPNQNSVDPEQNFAVFNGRPTGGQTHKPVSTLGSTAAKDDLIDPNNVDDLMKLKMLYIAMYNKEPKSIQDLVEFYNVILVKLDIVTRKQVMEFLNKFKNSHTAGKINTGSYQDGSKGKGATSGTSAVVMYNGGSGSYVVKYTNGYDTSDSEYAATTTGYARPSLKERIMKCKLRKFCRKNPSSSRCVELAAQSAEQWNV